MNKKDMDNLKELFVFLEVDMPSKVIPEEIIEGEVWTREDMFKSVKEIRAYLTKHFTLAFPELKTHNTRETTK